MEVRDHFEQGRMVTLVEVRAVKEKTDGIFAVNRQDQLGQDVMEGFGTRNDLGFSDPNSQRRDHVPDALTCGTNLVRAESPDRQGREIFNLLLCCLEAGNQFGEFN